MNFRTLFLVLLVGLTAAFAVVNWSAFTAPTSLWLGVGTVQAPLGLIMLGLLGLFAAVFLGWTLWLQGSALMETRRQSRELQAQRELADKAEASRFTDLRQFLSSELLRVSKASEDANARVLARLDQVEQRSRLAMEQSANSLSAYIGELEDRLTLRSLPGDRPLPPEAPVKGPVSYSSSATRSSNERR